MNIREVKKLNKTLKCILVGVAVILFVLSVVLFTKYAERTVIKNNYEEAIAMIKSGHYDDAVEKFKEGNKNFYEGDFTFGNYFRGDRKNYYKDTVELYAYALARRWFQQPYRWMEETQRYLNFIPVAYSGDLYSEINAFKIQFATEYKKYLKTQEEERRKEEESYSHKIPFVGMHEKYIGYTMMGNPHRVEKDNSKYGANMYQWDDVNGNLMLVVKCRDRRVYDVYKYGNRWTDDGKPIFGGSAPKKETMVKKEEKSDPYNVYDYSDPEDFYDDNYDDFWDYEDAEDYFNEHHN
mgnify:CR=1 FL=1